ncbi:MAG: HD domain-containing protein [Coriobacteriales bacterium]|jgi:dGTPase|nr:HD domain-containing protein [Coriobacteriales bacterium]
MVYRKLGDDIGRRIERDRANPAWQNPWRTDDSAALRRDAAHDRATLWRPAFVRDAEKILHSPYYNRLSDKTQVFSLYKNDDLTRRSLHVQLVSRIARSIGAVLGLNTDLIEAIALGHDIGHTPFGHAGERFLSALYHEHTGRFFDHNVHGVRVLDGIFQHNLSIQTLSGILCHNGEFEQQEYRPQPVADFAEFDSVLKRCYTHDTSLKGLVPSTIEGCIVRISDMIAYVGKDRQDAERAADRDAIPPFGTTEVGAHNAEIINNLTVDLIENSYGKDHLLFSEKAFAALRGIKQENFQLIYDNERINRTSENLVKEMFGRLYERLRADVLAGDERSYIFRHHIAFVERRRKMYRDNRPYREEQPDQIVVDYLASMTDDYFVDLHALLFPRETAIEYVPYFKPDAGV